MKKLLFASTTISAYLLLAGAAGAQVKFGVFAPITGSNAAFGKQFTDGAELAVENINQAGGILGQKIILSKGDDAADPKQGVSVANKLAGEGIKFVVGSYTSGVTIPSSEVFAENGVLQVSPGSTNPKVTERGLWNIHRTCGRDDQQGPVAAEYILQHYKGKKIAVVHDKSPGGQGIADEARKVLTAGGMKEVFYEGVNSGEKDFSALVTKLKSTGVDLVYYGGYYTEAGLILRQMRDQGVKAILVGGDGIASDEFAAIAGPGAEGTLMTFAPDPRRRPEAAKVVAAYQAKGINPEAFTLYSYAAVEVIRQAAENAKSLDPRKVAENIRSGARFQTVIGELSFDKKGDITRRDFVVYTWKKDADGKLGYVQN